MGKTKIQRCAKFFAFYIDRIITHVLLVGKLSGVGSQSSLFDFSVCSLISFVFASESSSSKLSTHSKVIFVTRIAER